MCISRSIYMHIYSINLVYQPKTRFLVILHIVTMFFAVTMIIGFDYLNKLCQIENNENDWHWLCWTVSSLSTGKTDDDWLFTLVSLISGLCVIVLIYGKTPAMLPPQTAYIRSVTMIITVTMIISFQTKN